MAESVTSFVFMAGLQEPIKSFVREAFLQKRQSLLWLATQKRMDMLRSLTADFVLLLKIYITYCAVPYVDL